LNKPLPSIDAYNEAIRFNPQDTYTYLVRAEAYMLLHDMDHAMADYSEAIRLDPLNPEAYRLRGEAFNEMGNKERADTDFAKGKELSNLHIQKSDNEKQ
jgi:Tfp pilus assembly protein PilF